MTISAGESLSLEYWPIDKLVAYSHNPRRNDDVVIRMRESIEKYGFRVPILARSDGTVVDGHLRLKAAAAMGLSTLPVLVSDAMTDDETRAFRIMVNASASWAEWDESKLRIEFEELATACYDLSLVGMDAAYLSRLMDFAPLDLQLPPVRVNADMDPGAPYDGDCHGDPHQAVNAPLHLPAESQPASVAPSDPLTLCPKCGYRFKP